MNRPPTRVADGKACRPDPTIWRSSVTTAHCVESLEFRVYINQQKLTVVFFSDRWMLCGLHAALASLLYYAKSKPLHVIVFSDKLTKREKRLLFQTVSKSGSFHTFEIKELSISWPVGIPSFHGNMTANARIFLATLLSDYDYCLYLDCDLLVLRDVNELLGLTDNDSAIMANMTSLQEHSPDYAILSAALASEQQACNYFHSGIFFASLAKWRVMQVESCCLLYFKKFENDSLLCPDQTVLNLVLGGSVQSLDDSWNRLLFPQYDAVSAIDMERTILHFPGLPKPWYPLGCLAHRNFIVWWKWFKQTAIAKDPISLLVQFCTPRKHFSHHFLITIRLIINRIKELRQSA
jgi:lipopolysaccharide biosynthesis glycosyltransferase